MTRTRPLAVVGNVNVDLIMGPVAPWPTPGSEVITDHDALRIGGSAGNAALTWAALGQDFQIAAHTGNDQFGSWLRDALAPHSGAWPIVDCGTTLSVGLTHPDGERTFFTTRGHLARLDWPQVRKCLDWDRLAGGYLLLCGCFLMDDLARDYDALFDQAKAHGIKVALDTGWPPGGWTPQARTDALHWVSRSTCLLLNEVETTTLAGCAPPDQAAATLHASMPAGAAVVVKCGADGALAQNAGGTTRVASSAVRVMDTIGAGDVFNAAFLGGVALGLPLAACLERGTRTAAIAISTAPRRYAPEPETDT
ncbi:MAG: carbohydrate kinase family protein [Paracoccaceae bacterium]|nr:carbohydrate kinase family protein [Paracoccaceae bacterium]